MKTNKLPYILLVLSLLFAVLAFGMRATWSRFVVDTLVYLALGVMLFQARKGERILYRVPGLVPLILIIGFMLFQIIPLPMGWISTLSPSAAELYRDAVVITGGLAKGTLSVTPDLTRLELFRFATVVCVYVLAIQLLTDRELLKKSINIAVVFGAVVALFGIVQHFTAGGKLYWFRELAGGHFGPFVYRNHFAGFMVLLFPLSFALFHLNKPQVRYGSFRERLADTLSGREVNLRVLYGLSALLVATSVFVSLSRGGVIALCFSAFVLTLLLLLQKGGSKKGLAVAFFFFLVILSVSWFGWEALIERFSKSVNAEGELWDGRFTYWKDTNRIASDFSLIGSGFGTFVSVYPSYQSIFVGDRMVSHAHGDYYELLATGGIIGFSLFASFVVVGLAGVVQVFRKRRDRYSRTLTLGLGAGLLGFSAQALAEFNFYSGAATLWFYFMAALCISAAHTRLRGRNSSYLRPVVHQKTVGMGALILTSLVFIASVYHNVSRLGAEFAFSHVAGVALEKGYNENELNLVFQSAEKAVGRNPLNARYHLAMASLYHVKVDQESSNHHFARAAALNPASADLFHRYARLGGGLDRNTITYCLEQARDRDVMNPARYKFTASSYFKEGRIAEAILDLDRAMEINPAKSNIEECLKLMAYNGIPFEEIAWLVPESAGPVLTAAAFFEATGHPELSESMIDMALDALLESKDQNIGHYFHMYNRLMKQDDVNRALSVVQAAARFYPDNERVYILTGDLYTKMGIGYRARDEYRKALAINPRNQGVQKKLEAL